MTPEFYATQWIATLFTYDLPIELSTRIVDLFLIDGWKVIFKTVLTILESIQEQLIVLEYEKALRYLKTFTQKMQFDEVRY